MHITFLLEEHIVRRAQRTAAAMGKTLEGILLDEIQKLADAAPPEESANSFEERPGVGSVSFAAPLSTKSASTVLIPASADGHGTLLYP